MANISSLKLCDISLHNRRVYVPTVRMNYSICICVQAYEKEINKKIRRENGNSDLLDYYMHMEEVVSMLALRQFRQHVGR
jgi:coproporphyrinogen III oxidase